MQACSPQEDKQPCVCGGLKPDSENKNKNAEWVLPVEASFLGALPRHMENEMKYVPFS